MHPFDSRKIKERFDLARKARRQDAVVRAMCKAQRRNGGEAA